MVKTRESTRQTELQSCDAPVLISTQGMVFKWMMSFVQSEITAACLTQDMLLYH